MKTPNEQLDRREFLKAVTLGAAGMAVTAKIASAAEPAGVPQESNASADAIPIRELGKTGLKLPMLGYGGAALVTAWGSPLSMEKRVELVRYAFDRGLRYFDTAPGYTESQSILGEALKDRRDQVCLVTKIDTTEPGEVRKMAEDSLKLLQTDHVDTVLIHGTPGLEQMTVEQAMNIHAEQVKLRDEKLTRFIGFSAHGYFDKALALIESGGFDMCMLSYGYIPRGYDQIWSARMTELRNACVARAHDRGMGIVAMKVVGAGMLGAWSGTLVPEFDKQRLKQLPAAAIRHVLQDKRIDILNIGMRLKGEIDANIKVLSGDATFTSEDRTLLAEYAAKLYDSDAIKKLKVE